MANNFDAISRTEDRFQLLTYKKMPIAAERGEGAWVFASDGEKYLDLYGGHAVTAADGELVIATPSDAKFLGYELQTPAVAADHMLPDRGCRCDARQGCTPVRGGVRSGDARREPPGRHLPCSCATTLRK